MFSYPPPPQPDSQFHDDVEEQQEETPFSHHTHHTTPTHQPPRSRPSSTPLENPHHSSPPPPPISETHGYPPSEAQAGRPLPRPPPPPPPSALGTQPFAWFIASMCAVFWVLIFLLGLIILTICLLYRPKIPLFEVSTATLNAAHLDVGANLLNADLTLLANISNPNKRLTVEFRYGVITLYFGRTMVSRRWLVGFTERRRESVFVAVHMVGSLVEMGGGEGVGLLRQIQSGGGVEVRVEGLLRVRTGLGGVFSFSYWVRGHCRLLMSPPPQGVVLQKRCFTRR